MSDAETKPPAEEQPAQEAPAQEQPAEAPPAEQPAAEAPAEEAQPAQPAPAEEKPAESSAPAEKAGEEPADAEEKPADAEEKPAAAGEPKVDPNVFSKAIGECYEDDWIDKPIEDSKISRRNIRFYNLMSQQSTKRYNVHFLEDDMIIYVTGNKYQTYNLDTKEIKTYDGLDTDGVGSICVHKSKRYFAVAEKGVWPNIYIRQNPGYKTYRILRKGTELSYAHVEFSPSGDKLVSLGGRPDYTLTVWDWRKERVILKCRAYGQDVYKCQFSPFSDDVLFTGGSGHIRFWKMAQTFTGLKLQGEIAKYGVLELSDATGWQELPDGKIVSGTEYGTMVLWEGNLVKAHLVLEVESKKPLHDGHIEVCMLDEDKIITAATDGYIKWWSLAQIDAAEADEHPEVAIDCLKAVQIKTESGEAAHIINIVRGNGLWLLSDAKGRLWRIDPTSFEGKVIMEYVSGEITDMAVSDAYNMALTCSEDGTVKVWDYTRAEAYYSQKFAGRANCIDLMRRSEQNKGRVAAVGFETGLVRILELSDSNIELAMVMKAADGPVDFVKYAPDQMTLVTASRNGEIFFFDINGHLDLGKCVPICQLVLQNCVKINDLRWDAKSENILICTESGHVHEIKRPDPAKLDVSDSYLIENYPMRTWRMKMMEFQMKKNQKKDEEEEERKRRARLRGELKDEDDEEEEDWEPEAITKVCYNESAEDPANSFIIGATGQYKGFYYLCSFNSDRPLTAIPLDPTWRIQQLSFNQTGEILIMTFDNSEVRLLNINFPERFLQIKQHDVHACGIAAAKFTFDERALLTAGKDGIIFCHALDKYMITQEAKFNPLAGVAGIDFMPESQVKEVIEEKTAEFQKANEANIPDYDPTVDGLDETLFSVSLRGFPDVCQDILDTSVYSIQQAKLRTEEDHRLKLAEEKKEGVRRKIEALRTEFEHLTKENEAQDEVVKVGSDDFNIDPEYFEMLLNRNAEKIEETKKEVAWNIEYNTVALHKLKGKFYDVLDFEKYTVKAMRNVHYVTTFRVPKMSEFLNKNIEQFRQLIAQEVAAKENYADDDDDEGLEDEHNKELEKKKTEKPKVVAVNNIQKTEAEKKREERKIQREIRKKKIEKLVKKEAMINSQEDISKNPEIEEARATYGDFKLKMSPDYEVPENLSINFSKKRQQMVLLEGSIHKLKVDFNNKIIDSKTKKTQIISQVEQMNQRITEINKVLGMEEELFLPSIDEKAEYPQRFFNVNDKDIDQYREYKIKKAAQEAAAAKGGGKRAAAKAAQEEKEAEELRKKQEEERLKAEEASKPKMKPTHNNLNPYLNAVPPRKGHKNMATDLDEEYDQILRIELEYEKEQLKQEAQTLVDDFDNEIKEMQKEKYRLESDLKNAEIKLILLFEELILLKSMEHKDQELTQQLTSNRQEKGQIMKEITEITKKLKEKKKEIDSIKHEEEMLLAKFHEYCPEGSAKYNEIRRFYERITKKRRKPEQKEKNEDDDDEEEGEAAEEEEEEQEQEDEDEDPAIAGLSQEDFKIDEIEKIRDERCQLYDAKEKIGIYITDLEGTRKKMENQERMINTELGDTEEEIRDFQKEKMSKLNQLQVSVVLKIKQIQNLTKNPEHYSNWQDHRRNKYEEQANAIWQDENLTEEEKQQMEAELTKKFQEDDYRGYYLQKTLDHSVLITRAQLLQLIERKRELDEENKALKKQQEEHKKQEKEKRREINENKKKCAEKEREYKERQMLRFGNLIDLDSLEVSGPSQAVLDKQIEFNKVEKKCIRDIEEKEAEFQKIQRELTECIQKNTDLLDMIRKEGERQLELNRKLDATNNAIFVDDDNAAKKDRIMAKERMKQQLEMQAKEIDILKTEINLYKRKGGHIYTKVTTNRRVAHLNQDN